MCVHVPRGHPFGAFILNGRSPIGVHPTNGFITQWVDIHHAMGEHSSRNGWTFITQWVDIHLPMGKHSSPNGQAIFSQWAGIHLPMGRHSSPSGLKYTMNLKIDLKIQDLNIVHTGPYYRLNHRLVTPAKPQARNTG